MSDPITSNSNYIKYNKNLEISTKDVAIKNADIRCIKIKLAVAAIFVVLGVLTAVAMAVAWKFSGRFNIGISDNTIFSTLFVSAAVTVLASICVFNFRKSLKDHRVKPNELFDQIISCNRGIFADWKVALFEKWGKHCSDLNLSSITLAVSVNAFYDWLAAQCPQEADRKSVAEDVHLEVARAKKQSSPRAMITMEQLTKIIKDCDTFQHRGALSRKVNIQVFQYYQGQIKLHVRYYENAWERKNVIRILNSCTPKNVTLNPSFNGYQLEGAIGSRLISPRAGLPNSLQQFLLSQE